MKKKSNSQRFSTEYNEYSDKQSSSRNGSLYTEANSYSKNVKLTEDIFCMQRSIISQMKQTQSNSNRSINEKELYFNHEKIISFININRPTQSNWEYSTFTTDYVGTQEVPRINSKRWNKSEPFATPIEIRNLIFRSQDYIDYGLANAEINANLTLQGESTFWLTLHNENTIYENTSAILQISKTENSQKVFASLGVFLSEYKIFSRQQLVNFNNNNKNNQIYLENDSCNIKLVILDPGDDNITFKIYINNSFFENTIEADFFIPVNDKRKVFIGGSGHSCFVNQFESITSVKPKYVKEYNIQSHKNPYTQNQKNCDCCLIF